MQVPALPTDRFVLVAALAVTLSVLLAAPVALWYWARSEARARTDQSTTLAVLSGFLSGIGIVSCWYDRFVRHDDGRRDEPPTRRERVAATYTMAVAPAFFAGLIVSPPDPFTQILLFPPLFAVTFVAVYLVGSYELL